MIFKGTTNRTERKRKKALTQLRKQLVMALVVHSLLNHTNTFGVYKQMKFQALDSLEDSG